MNFWIHSIHLNKVTISYFLVSLTLQEEVSLCLNLSEDRMDTAWLLWAARAACEGLASVARLCTLSLYTVRDVLGFLSVTVDRYFCHCVD